MAPDWAKKGTDLFIRIAQVSCTRHPGMASSRNLAQAVQPTGGNVPLPIFLRGVAWIVGSLDRLQSNIYFGAATKDLIHNTIIELENGNTERVLSELKNLRSEFYPSYETRDDYDTLVANYVNVVSDSPVIHERGLPGWADDYATPKVPPDQPEEGVTKP